LAGRVVMTLDGIAVPTVLVRCGLPWRSTHSPAAAQRSLFYANDGACVTSAAQAIWASAIGSVFRLCRDDRTAVGMRHGLQIGGLHHGGGRGRAAELRGRTPAREDHDMRRPSVCHQQDQRPDGGTESGVVCSWRKRDVARNTRTRCRGQDRGPIDIERPSSAERVGDWTLAAIATERARMPRRVLQCDAHILRSRTARNGGLNARTAALRLPCPAGSGHSVRY
jgi:hypothetical protein